MFKGPADIAVEEVHTILRQIVFRTLESEDCKALQQYTHLKREIAQTAAATLGMLDPDPIDIHQLDLLRILFLSRPQRCLAWAARNVRARWILDALLGLS